jgi:hypothetical protein
MSFTNLARMFARYTETLEMIMSGIDRHKMLIRMMAITHATNHWNFCNEYIGLMRWRI